MADLCLVPSFPLYLNGYPVAGAQLPPVSKWLPSVWCPATPLYRNGYPVSGGQLPPIVCYGWKLQVIKPTIKQEKQFQDKIMINGVPETFCSAPDCLRVPSLPGPFMTFGLDQTLTL